MLSTSRREVDWPTLFGNRHPVEIEIGSGKGAFLLAYAERHPELNLLGIENQPRWASWIEKRLRKTPRANARILCADAALVLSAFVRDGTVAAYHLYFPDPWWKRRHHKRRLVQAGFAKELLRTLQPGGVVHLATDVADRFASMKEELSRLPFATHIEAEPTPHGRPLTNFERKYRAEGRPLYYATFTKSRR